MATQIICDECGEPIDLTQAYYQVMATKVVVENANDPSLPNTTTVVEIAQNFDYHDGHQPKVQELPLAPNRDLPDPEPQPLALTQLDPSSVAKGTPVTLRALGTGFTDTDNIVFNGNEIDTTFISDTELSCEPDVTTLNKSNYDVRVRQDSTDTDPLPFAVT